MGIVHDEKNVCASSHCSRVMEAEGSEVVEMGQMHTFIYMYGRDGKVNGKCANDGRDEVFLFQRNDFG